MRRWMFAAALLAAACDRAGRRPDGAQAGPGIVPDDSGGSTAGEDLRLDLGAVPALPDLPRDGSSGAGEAGSSSTGADDSSSSGTSTGEAATSTGGEASSSGSGSSTGEALPVCGDGTCEAAERAPCWGWQNMKWAPGFCYEDCHADPACESDCPCTPEAAAVMNFCHADPPVQCSATAPGGFCGEPGGDVPGFYAWAAKCK